MTVRLVDGAIGLEGACHLEDAVALLDLMTAHPELPIDLHKCTRVHMAVAQILLAGRPTVQRKSKDPFLKDWLLPLLEARSDQDNAIRA